jgi:hypothetical protein
MWSRSHAVNFSCGQSRGKLQRAFRRQSGCDLHVGSVDRSFDFIKCFSKSAFSFFGFLLFLFSVLSLRFLETRFPLFGERTRAKAHAVFARTLGSELRPGSSMSRRMWDGARAYESSLGNLRGASGREDRIMGTTRTFRVGKAPDFALEYFASKNQSYSLKQTEIMRRATIALALLGGRSSTQRRRSNDWSMRVALPGTVSTDYSIAIPF